MMDKRKLAISAAVISLSVGLTAGTIGSAIASDHDETMHAEEDVAQARAHVHGAWEMFAALDAKALTVTFTGPLADVAGEEHPYGSPEEDGAIDRLRSELSEAEALVGMSQRAGCSLEGAPTVMRTASTDDHDHDHEEGHEEHPEHEDHDDHDDHDGHHDDDHHEDHAKADHDDHDHDDEDHANHDHDDDHDSHGADIEIVYAYQCEAPSRLTSFDVSAFKSFEAIETIDAVFLGGSKQVANRLTPAKSTLSVD